MKTADQINAPNAGYAQPLPRLEPTATRLAVLPVDFRREMRDRDALIAARIRHIAHELGSGCFRADAVVMIHKLADELEAER